MDCLGIASPSWQRILHGLTGIGHFIVHIKIIYVCRITKSVVPDVFSGVKMVEYVSAPRTPLPGAYSAPQTLTGQRGKCKEKEGRGGEDGNGNDGRVGNRYGI